MLVLVIWGSFRNVLRLSKYYWRKEKIGKSYVQIIEDLHFQANKFGLYSVDSGKSIKDL